MTDRYCKVATLIIKITNPVYLGLLIIVVAVCLDSKDFTLLTRALSVLFIFMIVLPLGYIWLRTHAAGLRGNPTEYLKHHPIDILALEIVCGLPCWFILSYFKAPEASTHILIVLIVTAFITAVINIFYRSSFHLAAFTVLLIVVVRNWGVPFLFLLVIIPAIAWAKYYLRQHTPAQLLFGTITGAIIGFAVTLL